MHPRLDPFDAGGGEEERSFCGIRSWGFLGKKFCRLKNENGKQWELWGERFFLHSIFRIWDRGELENRGEGVFLEFIPGLMLLGNFDFDFSKMGGLQQWIFFTRFEKKKFFTMLSKGTFSVEILSGAPRQ